MYAKKEKRQYLENFFCANIFEIVCREKIRAKIEKKTYDHTREYLYEDRSCEKKFYFLVGFPDDIPRKEISETFRESEISIGPYKREE